MEIAKACDGPTEFELALSEFMKRLVVQGLLLDNVAACWVDKSIYGSVVVNMVLVPDDEFKAQLKLIKESDG